MAVDEVELSRAASGVVAWCVSHDFFLDERDARWAYNRVLECVGAYGPTYPGLPGEVAAGEVDGLLDTLSEVAVSHVVAAPISIRVNPDVDAGTHPYISTGLKENKFGIAIADAEDVYIRAAQLPNLEVLGVDCHIGSQLTSLPPFLDALDRLLALIDRLGECGIYLHHIDLGGGVGVRYRDEEPPLVADYIKAVRERIEGRDLTLMFEPGRYVVANAGVLLTQVEYLKHTEHKDFAIVDAAMNDLIRPALYQAWMNVTAVTPRDSEARAYDIVGPICETGDFLAKDRQLALEEGDLLAVHSAGAYGFVMSSNYNTRGRTAEVLVDGDQAFEVRRRETVAELYAGESLLPE